MPEIINQKLHTLRSQVAEIVKDLHDLTTEIGHEELARTVSDLRNRIEEPFMFVIVGEVKAGKSSFINALLSTGKEICRVAPQPMTDTIQQVVYGEKEAEVVLSPYLKKIYQPVEILKEIAIVDTPGTNTIVEHHQEITERFIPASDLIVFVFEAKNPYRQSAWEFFDFIHVEWRRKVIFVLQQKDLMNETDLAVNVSGVVHHAQKKGIGEPKVFAVSAKIEQENSWQLAVGSEHLGTSVSPSGVGGSTSGHPLGSGGDSGFAPLRQYILENITGGKAPILKLQNNLDTSRNINERIYKGLLDRKKQWQADVTFRRDVRETLEKQEAKSLRQVDMLVENLLAGYDRITLATGQELDDGLSFFSLLKRSIAGIFSKKASAKEWLESLAQNLDRDLHLELQNKLNENLADLADSIQGMAKIIDLKIYASQTILRNNHEIFSDIAERRSNVMRELQDTFSRFLSRPENFAAEELFPDRKPVSPSLASGSGLAVVGILLAALTKGVVFDVTGGVLTTIGVVFAGVTSTLKRKKILDTYQAEIAKGRLNLEGELTGKLKTYVAVLKEKIDDNFDDFDAMLEREEGQISKLEQRHGSIERRLAEVENQLSVQS